jgi:polysaccharide pyruvyl transferase WcaK-like protein
LDHNFDGYFYLDFAQKKKISYAASIGTEKISSEKQVYIEQYLQDFSAISVREKQSAQQLTRMLKRKVEWVLDPTLLQDTAFWERFCGNIKIPRGKYLLCYFLNDQPWYFDYAKELANYLGLKMVLIPARAAFATRKETWRRATGPKEFVSLIRGAEFVLTDSYHGSIFAMQFNKPFLHFKRFAENDPVCQNIRIHSLFSLVELESLILEEKTFSPEDIRPIDYERVQNILEQHRKTSRAFLKQHIWESL